MSTVNMMMEYLQKEGLVPTRESYGIAFRYQMKNFLFFDNDEDPSFFQLVMPGICDVTDENREHVYQVMDSLNGSLKVAKAVTFNNEVWLFAELLIDSTPVLDDFVPRALGILQHAYRYFRENY